jgi:hypothetical protein
MEHESNLRDLAAMFAMLGLVQRMEPDMIIDNNGIAQRAYYLADAMMKARVEEPEEGLAAIKKGKRNVRKHEDIR